MNGYEFSIIPSDILGHVYEQFLGKIITVDTRRRVSIEKKPEVRKAGGVFYTPSYVAEYIVEKTVGDLQKGRTIKQADRIRILDPACGSGSFLIIAYQTMLNWYRDQYVADGLRKRKEIYEGTSGQ